MQAAKDAAAKNDDAGESKTNEGKRKAEKTSFLQRHFAIGYNRAARIVDAFERQGIVSSANSMGRREVLIDE